MKFLPILRSAANTCVDHLMHKSLLLRLEDNEKNAGFADDTQENGLPGFPLVMASLYHDAWPFLTRLVGGKTCALADRIWYDLRTEEVQHENYV